LNPRLGLCARTFLLGPLSTLLARVVLFIIHRVVQNRANIKWSQFETKSIPQAVVVLSFGIMKRLGARYLRWSDLRSTTTSYKRVCACVTRRCDLCRAITREVWWQATELEGKSFGSASDDKLEVAVRDTCKGQVCTRVLLAKSVPPIVDVSEVNSENKFAKWVCHQGIWQLILRGSYDARVTSTLSDRKFTPSDRKSTPSNRKSTLSDCKYIACAVLRHMKDLLVQTLIFIPPNPTSTRLRTRTPTWVMWLVR
jgi:hypothetical protein